MRHQMTNAAIKHLIDVQTRTDKLLKMKAVSLKEQYQ